MAQPLLDPADLAWLRSLARALLHEPHAAEDLTQDTLVAALERPVPAGVPRRAWLRGIARRLAARHHRSAERRGRLERGAARDEALPDASSLVARAEAAEQLVSALRALDEPFRTTLLLRFLEGLSPEAIAARERRAVDTVRWRVRRGLELLRSELQRRESRMGTALLVPLSLLARSSGEELLAAAPTGLTWTTTVLFGMKLSHLAAAAAVVLTCALAWRSLPRVDGGVPERPAAPRAGNPELAVSAEPLPVLDAPESTDARRVRAAVGADSSPASAPSGPRVFGRVLDPAGAPVADATVWLASPPDDDAAHGGASPAQPSGPLAVGRSGLDGSFRLDVPEGYRPDLGVLANGLERGFVRAALERQPADGWEVRLQRGLSLAAQVVDAAGDPVDGLELLVHTDDAPVRHVSPSQMALRSARLSLGDASATFRQCIGRTDASGWVRFSGLPSDALAVRSLDPGWSLWTGGGIRADGMVRKWLAERRLGVVLTVVDARTQRRLERAAAVFRFEVEYEDGTVEDHGQWVGRGEGEVSLLLGEEIQSVLGEREITRIRFYGSVEVPGARAEWSSEPLLDPLRTGRVAFVRVPVDPERSVSEPEPTKPAASGATEAPEDPEPATAVVELDVVIDGAGPFEGRLAVDWSARLVGGGRREGDDTLQPLSPGRYRLEVPAGALVLRASDARASGSLLPWSGSADVAPDGLARVLVTLPRGARVRIARPDGWTGEWFVHASWRRDEGDWRGSWNYSTRGDALELSALEPVEWRFRLRRDDQGAPVEATHVVRLEAGRTTDL